MAHSQSERRAVRRQYRGFLGTINKRHEDLKKIAQDSVPRRMYRSRRTTHPENKIFDKIMELQVRVRECIISDTSEVTRFKSHECYVNLENDAEEYLSHLEDFLSRKNHPDPAPTPDTSTAISEVVIVAESSAPKSDELTTGLIDNTISHFLQARALGGPAFEAALQTHLDKTGEKIVSTTTAPDIQNLGEDPSASLPGPSSPDLPSQVQPKSEAHNEEPTNPSPSSVPNPIPKPTVPMEISTDIPTETRPRSPFLSPHNPSITLPSVPLPHPPVVLPPPVPHPEQPSKQRLEQPSEQPPEQHSSSTPSLKAYKRALQVEGEEGGRKRKRVHGEGEQQEQEQDERNEGEDEGEEEGEDDFWEVYENH